MDVYVSRKRRKSSSLLFAWVKVPNKHNAMKIIKELDGQVIRGHKLGIKEAKYRRHTRNNLRLGHWT